MNEQEEGDSEEQSIGSASAAASRLAASAMQFPSSGAFMALASNPELKDAMRQVSSSPVKQVAEALSVFDAQPPQMPKPRVFQPTISVADADDLIAEIGDKNQKDWAYSAINDLEELHTNIPPGLPSAIPQQLKILLDAVQAVLLARLHREDNVDQDFGPYTDALIGMLDWYLTPWIQRRFKTRKLRPPASVPLAQDLKDILDRYSTKG